MGLPTWTNIFWWHPNWIPFRGEITRCGGQRGYKMGKEYCLYLPEGQDQTLDPQAIDQSRTFNIPDVWCVCKRGALHTWTSCACLALWSDQATGSRNRRYPDSSNEDHSTTQVCWLSFSLWYFFHNFSWREKIEIVFKIHSKKCQKWKHPFFKNWD